LFVNITSEESEGFWNGMHVKEGPYSYISRIDKNKWTLNQIKGLIDENFFFSINIIYH
jgi:hypothetical protein